LFPLVVTHTMGMAHLKIGHSNSYSTEVTNGWSYTSTPSMGWTVTISLFLHRCTVVSHWPTDKTFNKTSRCKWRRHKYNDKEIVMSVFVPCDVMSQELVHMCWTNIWEWKSCNEIGPGYSSGD